MKIRALILTALMLAAAGAAHAAGAPAPSTASAVLPAQAGPPTPAADPSRPSQADGTDPGDFAARVALERSELVVPAAGPAPAAAGPADGAANPAAAVTADLGAVLGLGVSAALIAFSLVLAWAQRRHLRALLRPLASGRAGEGLLRPASPRVARTSAPVAAPAAASESASLKALALELQGTIEELRAERSRWEREWQEREAQWSRWIRRSQRDAAEAAAGPEGESAPASPSAAPFRMPEADALPALAAAEEARGAAPRLDAAGVLERVEQLLAEGLSAEEISRRLRVGLREIQWMMRLGTLEAGTRS
ncbi:MAG: hypothetical protein HZB25_08660 [Candidatus Eisenbacteria bacterium]|nr:hypothetical protein [Candidatus Eisenbacteria bacterium]